MDGLFGRSDVVYVGQSLVLLSGSVICERRSTCLFQVLLFSQENILAAGPQRKDESMIYHGTRQMAFLSTAGGFTSFGT